MDCFPCGLPFYLGRTATLVTTDGRELTSNYIIFRLKNDPLWPTNVVALTNLDLWLAQRNHPVFLIAWGHGRSHLEPAAGIYKADIQPLAQSYYGVLIPAR